MAMETTCRERSLSARLHEDHNLVEFQSIHEIIELSVLLFFQSTSNNTGEDRAK